MDLKEYIPQLRCGAFGMGIIIMLGFYGVIQERVMSVPYGGELFKASVFLVLINRLFAVAFAGTMCAVNQESPVNKAPLWGNLDISEIVQPH